MAFFLSFIFSPWAAVCVSISIAITAASWLMPSQWFSILLLVGGIAYTIFSDKSGLRDWLCLHFSSRRTHKLNRSKYDSRSELYKTLSYFCLLLTWLVPRVRIVTLGLLISIPLLAVIRSFRFPRNAPFGSYDKGELSPTADALLISGLFMCIWVITNQQYNRSVWLYSGIFASVWILLFLIFNHEYKEKITVALGFIVCIAIFSFGIICNVNREYDFHPPKQYIETVTDEHVSSTGKSQTCYVTVTPWAGQQGNSDIQVNRETYQKVGIGKKVYVLNFQGALGIGWYDLYLHPIS